MLTASPALASASVDTGANRRDAATYYLDEINHYVYAGDTALHIAAAAYEARLVRTLIDGGADPKRTNKSGSTPMQLATQPTGRGGTGSTDAKGQQALMVELLEPYSATP